MQLPFVRVKLLTHLVQTAEVPLTHGQAGPTIQAELISTKPG